MSIAANETINAADGQTIMIISEEQLEAAQIENTFGTQIISTEVHTSLHLFYRKHIHNNSLKLLTNNVLAGIVGEVKQLFC